MMGLKRHEISAHNGNRESNKVSGPNSIIYLNQTLIFEWWVVQCRSQNGHQKTYVSKRLEYVLKICQSL